MFHTTMRAAGLVVLALGLAGCELRDDAAPGMMMMTDRSPFEEIDMRLVYAGRNAVDAVSSEQSIIDLLDRLGARPNANLGRRIDGLLNNPRGLVAGLGGVQARALLHAAKTALDNNGNFAAPPETVSVKGQIQQTQNGEPGFLYRSGEPMHIWVQMVTTTTRILGPNPKSKIVGEMFRVEIPHAAMTVEPKTGSGGNVFPLFAQQAFPIHSDNAQGMNFKLWAVGEDVRVTDYWIDDNVNPNTGPYYPPGRRYTASNHPANLASIFAARPDACFDMMFADDPRLEYGQGGALQNGQLPPGEGPPFYCLGRCTFPPIVNTR